MLGEYYRILQRKVFTVWDRKLYGLIAVKETIDEITVGITFDSNFKLKNRICY